jgi:arylsulfatase
LCQQLIRCGGPLITNLKLDPFKRFHNSRGFDEWQENRSWTLGSAGAQVAKFMKSLQDYRPRQKSFDIDLDEMMKAMTIPENR